MRLLEELVKLRKVLKDLHRAEVVAAKEHDMIRAAARDGAGDGTSVQRPPTSDTHGRRESGADRLRHESSQALDSAEYDKAADEMSDQEALVEELAAQATRDLQAGREAAEKVREDAVDAIEVYTAGDGTAEAEAAKAVEVATQANVDAQAIEAAFNAKVTELSVGHRAEMAKVDELHLALEQSDDRTRWIRQRTPTSSNRTTARGGSGRGRQSRTLSLKCRSEPRTRGKARQSQKRTCITMP
jgi:hypothetical protein